jgi:protein ImuB
MTLADARARCPEVKALPHDGDADAALLARQLLAFGRFSPMVARDPPHGLMLDITGCAHLFGGEAGLVKAVQAFTAQAGLQARLAIAKTPQTARALTRFGRGGAVAHGEDRTAARRLPVAALELPDADTVALKRAGLKTLADLDARPRAVLAARFGAGFAHRLDRVLGLEDTRITPVRPALPIRADRVMLEPILETEALETVIGDLLVETMEHLEAKGVGARLFILTVFRVDGAHRKIGVGARAPVRDAGVVGRLFRERLASLATPVDPGFGIDQLRIEARRLRAWGVEQPEFGAPARLEAGLDSLVDQLTVRLGPQSVVHLTPAASHLPEAASHPTPAATPEPLNAAWPSPDPEDPPLRPLYLFEAPQPVEAVALAPDSPPAQFTWRRIRHRVVRAEGPERIEDEWWRRPKARLRDYYRVEDEAGRRYWLFRAGQFGEEPGPRWYLHGLFS